MRTHLLTTTAVLALFSASTVSTRAQTSWTGLINDNWFQGLNWTAGAPTIGTSATIDTLRNAPVSIGGPGANAQSLVVGRVGVGSLIIQNVNGVNGGVLTTFEGGFVGAFVGRGDVTVTGPGSIWVNSPANPNLPGIQVGGGIGIGTLTVTNGGFVNAGFFEQHITVGGGGGRLSGALIGDGGVTSTDIKAGGFLVPGRDIVPGQGGTPAAMTVAGNLAFQ